MTESYINYELQGYTGAGPAGTTAERNIHPTARDANMSGL